MPHRASALAAGGACFAWRRFAGFRVVLLRPRRIPAASRTVRRMFAPEAPLCKRRQRTRHTASRAFAFCSDMLEQ